MRMPTMIIKGLRLIFLTSTAAKGEAISDADGYLHR
jgi:hypothetical protein